MMSSDSLVKDRGHDGRFNKTPGSSRFSPDNSVLIGVIFPGSANFVEEVQSTENSGEALFVVQKAQNILPGRVVWG